jgi:hypothetical protein
LRLGAILLLNQYSLPTSYPKRTKQTIKTAKTKKDVRLEAKPNYEAG